MRNHKHLGFPPNPTLFEKHRFTGKSFALKRLCPKGQLRKHHVSIQFLTLPVHLFSVNLESNCLGTRQEVCRGGKYEKGTPGPVGCNGADGDKRHDGFSCGWIAARRQETTQRGEIPRPSGKGSASRTGYAPLVFRVR